MRRALSFVFFFQVVESVGRNLLLSRRSTILRRLFATFAWVTGRFVARFHRLFPMFFIVSNVIRFLEILNRIRWLFNANVSAPCVFCFTIDRYAPVIVVAMANNVLRVRVLTPIYFRTFNGQWRKATIRIDKSNRVNYVRRDKGGVARLCKDIYFSQYGIINEEPFRSM